MTIDTAIARLRDLLGDRLSVAAAIREHHGQNEAYYPVTPPDAVAFPESTEEVAEIVRICGAEGCPVVPWGVGTSLEGHALAFQGGVTLDMSRMDKVLEVHEADMDAVVQPGVTREALNADLRATACSSPSIRARTPRWAAWRPPARRAPTRCATAPCARRCWA